VENTKGFSDESIFEYVVVYDPDGGFVTGGGWIDSPEGAYIPDPLLTGKANFGFVSKYKKGATRPTGQTEFHFKTAKFHFHSNSYDWLVVSHHKAKYKGTGAVNGAGNFGFMLSAIDAALTNSTNEDLFRIKIWDKDNGDAVIYDNQQGTADNAEPTTAIGGGSIIIHGSEPETAPVLSPVETCFALPFPQPANPDVWIPYQLNSDNKVVIRIYDISGRLVRFLDLGNQSSGYYTSKEKAAHWDGRNEAGERVASGIFFYNIQAGRYTATKKIVIAK